MQRCNILLCKMRLCSNVRTLSWCTRKSYFSACDTRGVATVLNASEFPPDGIAGYVRAKQIIVSVRDVSGRNVSFLGLASSYY